MALDKYCIECGKELIKKSIRCYDRQTGEPIYNLACPSGLCNHTGCFHKFIKIGFFFYKQQCTLCGHIEHVYQDLNY